MNRASVRVESERSLRSGEAILNLIDGVTRANDVAVRRPLAEGITEVPVDELAKYVSATVQRRLWAGAMGL